MTWFGKTIVRGYWLGKDFLSLLWEHVIPILPSHDITFYTEHKRYGTIYRAHPSYQSTQEWYDWEYIKFYNAERGVSYFLPSKICCFGSYKSEEIEYSKIMVIVQCAEEMGSKGNDDDLFPIVQRRILDEHYKFVDADCIDGPCYAVPDISEEKNEEGVIIVKPMISWADKFINLNFTYY